MALAPHLALTLTLTSPLTRSGWHRRSKRLCKSQGRATAFHACAQRPMLTTHPVLSFGQMAQDSQLYAHVLIKQ